MPRQRSLLARFNLAFLFRSHRGIDLYHRFVDLTLRFCPFCPKDQEFAGSISSCAARSTMRLTSGMMAALPVIQQAWQSMMLQLVDSNRPLMSSPLLTKKASMPGTTRVNNMAQPTQSLSIPNDYLPTMIGSYVHIAGYHPSSMFKLLRVGPVNSVVRPVNSWKVMHIYNRRLRFTKAELDVYTQAHQEFVGTLPNCKGFVNKFLGWFNK